MKLFFKLMLVITLVLPLGAQDTNKSVQEAAPRKDVTPPDNAYKLLFNIYETEDGKRINQREYTMVIRTIGGWGSIKIGTRIPATLKENQVQYLDIGLEIRCLLRESTPGRIQAQMDINLSSFALPEQNSNPGGSNLPVLRTTNVAVDPLLSLGRPTQVASIDDVNSKKRMQVEVTATKFD